MPSGSSASGSVSRLYCGLVRERGTVRMSTTASAPASRSSAANSSRLRVEWPIVKIVTCGRDGSVGEGVPDEDGVLALGTGREQRDRGLDQLLEAPDVLDRRGRQVRPGTGAAGAVAPPFERLEQ